MSEGVERRVPSGARAVELPPGLRLDGSRSPVLVATQIGLRGLVGIWARGGLAAAGAELIPEHGPLLVCSNHLSNVDPLVLGACLPRVVHVMAKAEVFGNPLLRAYLERCNCFPVRRGALDRRALRAALAVLGSGGALVLFPEGHRGIGRGLLPFAAGAGHLALRSGAEVVPCALWGTERILPKGRLLPRRGPISIRFGAPFRPSSRTAEEASRQIQERVAAMLPAAYLSSADADQGDAEDERGVGRDRGPV